jgi:cysteinyl-tRNA synthetase
MTVRIYDSLQRKVVPLKTRDEERVQMYVCGPTVYNYIHIGNARTVVWFDAIRRYLVYRGYDVNYVMNYTDVDDKLIERAKLEKLSTNAISAKYSDAFEQDMRNLGARGPDIICRATDHIEDMVKAIEGLVEKGAAYAVDGDVFFAVNRFDGYGKLSGRSLDDMRARERIEPHPDKRHPLDFALWKAAKEGEPAWESPWGLGRPGWHIECSVMSTKCLGMDFDIHGGGSDLIFPHHENEIAQAETLEEGSTFVRYWLHAGMVQDRESEKMSKSLGNVALAHDVLERYALETVRYWMLMGSYRTQAVFSEDVLDDATQSYERWRIFHAAARHALGDSMPERPEAPLRPIADEVGEPPPGYVQRFIEAMDDDFNSAEAFAVIHDLVREANRRIEGAQLGEEQPRDDLITLTEQFLELTVVLGFGFPGEGPDSELLAGLIRYLLELREQARNDKDFDRADGIRARLQELGVTIEDTPKGARWHVGETSTVPEG